MKNEELKRILLKLMIRIRADDITIHQCWWPSDVASTFDKCGIYSLVARTHKNSEYYRQVIRSIIGSLKEFDLTKETENDTTKT